MEKILKRIVTLILILVAFSGCGHDGVFRIGILQLVEHQALDESRKGFIDGLAESGYSHKFDVDYQNAQGEQANCTSIANKFINSRKDLVLAIATPAAQAIVNFTKKVPVLVSCVTDPQSAGLVKSNENPGGNVTGVSDLAPIAKQIGLVKELLPDAKKLGIFYCANEANSKYQCELARAEAEKLGLEVSEYTVSQLSEIRSCSEYMASLVDVVYTPTDNVVASSLETITEAAAGYGVPVICSDVNIVSKGSIGTYGMSYYKLGKLASVQAVKILIDGVYPGDIPIGYLEDADLVLNFDALDKLKISVPENLRNIAVKA